MDFSIKGINLLDFLTDYVMGGCVDIFLIVCCFKEYAIIIYKKHDD